MIQVPYELLQGKSQYFYFFIFIFIFIILTKKKETKLAINLKKSLGLI